MTWADRIAVYQPGTDNRLGYLPEPLSWSASLPRNDAGALNLTYSSVSAGGELLATGLADGLEIGLELNWGAGWLEPRGGRFVRVDRSINPADRTGAINLVCPSYGWLLSKIRNLDLNRLEVGGDFAGRRLYQNATAGDIMRSQLDEYASRHAVPPALTWGFTADADSAGQAWTDRRTLPYPDGDDLRSILAGLASMGMCDWQTAGRALALFVADSQSVDRSATVRLELERDISDAPSTESLADTVGYTLVRGEGAVVATVTEESAPTAWGVWEGYLSASGATTEAEARTAVAHETERRARAAGEYTRTLIIDDSATWLPIRDYAPGDIVTALAVTTREAMRVQQITLTRDSQGVRSGSVVLNDRLVPPALQTTKRVAALLSGAALAGSGVARGTEDQRVPAAPTGLMLAEQKFQDAQGIWRSGLGASWNPVTQSTGGTEMAIASYELWGTPGAGTARMLTSGPGTTASWQPFEPGSTWSFAVAAVGGNGKRSLPCPVVVRTFGQDTVAPLRPSTPTVSSRLGALVCIWDGLDYQGAAQPSDWRITEVHVSTTSGFSPAPASLKGTFTSARGGQVSILDLDYEVPHFVKLVAVDWTGNRSAPSTQVSGVPTRVVSNDMAQAAIDEVIDAAVEYVSPRIAGKSRMWYQATKPPGTDHEIGDTWFNTANNNQINNWSGADWVPMLLGNAAIADYSLAVAKLLIGDLTNQVENGDFETGNLRSWTGAGWVIGGSAPHAGQYNAVLNTAGTTGHLVSDTIVPVTPGDTWVCTGWFDNGLTGGGAAVTLGVLFDTGATAISSVPVSTGGWVRSIARIVIPAGVKTIRLRVGVGPGTTPGGWVRVDDLSLRRANGGELIVDGAIQAGSGIIGEAAIGRAQIGSVDAGTVDTGYLHADRLAARSVAISKLMITDITNYVHDGTFLLPRASCWSLGTITTWADRPNELTMSSVTANNTNSTNSHTFAVTPGDEYWSRVEVFAQNTNATINSCGITMVIMDAAGTALTYLSMVKPTIKGQWVTAEGKCVIPAGAVQARFALFIAFNGTAGNVYSFRNASAYRRNGGSLLVDGSVGANQLAAQIALLGQVYAGDPAGPHSQMDPDGFSVWALDGGAVKPWLRNDADGLTMGFDGSPDASIRPGGAASFQSVTTESLRVGGETMADMLWRAPKGLVAYTEGTVPVTAISNTERAIIELRTSLEYGRMYDIRVNPVDVRATNTGAKFDLKLRIATDGEAVTTASTLFMQRAYSPPLANDYNCFGGMVRKTGTTFGPRDVRFLLTAIRSAGSGTLDVWASGSQPIILECVDVGPYVAPTTVAVQRTSVWQSNAMYFNGTGAALTSKALTSTSQFVQAIFTAGAVSGEAGLALGAAAGSTVVKAEVYVYADSINAVGTTGRCKIAVNTNANANGATGQGAQMAALEMPRAPGGKWYDITSIWSAATRSINITEESYAAYGMNSITVLNSAAHRIQLRLTYYR